MSYSLKTSISAGENFGNQVAVAENGKIHSVLFIEHVNGIRLEPKTTNYIGLKTIKVKRFLFIVYIIIIFILQSQYGVLSF